MTGTMLFTTVFEIAAVMLIIIGLLNEKKLIAFEDKLGSLIGKALRKYIRRHYIKKQAEKKMHLHAVPNTRSSNMSADKPAKYIA